MCSEKADRELTFTGERVVPGKTPPFLVLEHLVRYRFAARFAGACKVLDVGCGSGYGAALLAEKANLVVGADSAAEAIQHAQENYRHASLYYTRADCRALPFRDRCFDLVVLFEVIEHISEQNQCLSEIRRVLSPEGILILSTPNPARSTKLIEEPNPFHCKELTEHELLELLRPHFGSVQLLYQQELSGSGIQAVAGATTGPAEVIEDFCVDPAAKYFMAVCGTRPARVSVARSLGLSGIEHQIEIVQDLRQAQKEIEALLRQREENQREYAKSLAAHEQEIRALLRQREQNQREYAENLAAHQDVIREKEQRIAALEETLRQEIEIRDRQLAELDWLYRWIPVNKLARKLLYGRNLRQRLMARLHLKA